MLQFGNLLSGFFYKRGQLHILNQTPKNCRFGKTVMSHDFFGSLNAYLFLGEHIHESPGLYERKSLASKGSNVLIRAKTVFGYNYFCI